MPKDGRSDHFAEERDAKGRDSRPLKKLDRASFYIPKRSAKIAHQEKMKELLASFTCDDGIHFLREIDILPTGSLGFTPLSSLSIDIYNVMLKPLNAKIVLEPKPHMEGAKGVTCTRPASSRKKIESVVLSMDIEPYMKLCKKWRLDCRNKLPDGPYDDPDRYRDAWRRMQLGKSSAALSER